MRLRVTHGTSAPSARKRRVALLGGLLWLGWQRPAEAQDAAGTSGDDAAGETKTEAAAKPDVRRGDAFSARDAAAAALQNQAAPAAATPAPAEAGAKTRSGASASGAAHGDKLTRPGYVPGYRTVPWLGLPPHIAHSATPFGNLSAPYGAPSPRDSWSFNYSGFFAAGVRASLRQRDVTHVSLAPLESPTAIRNGINTGGSFNAGAVQGSWVQMNFEYGNRVATAHVTIDTWNPSRGASFTQLGSQNFIDSAYLTFRLPPKGKARLGWTFGAFGVNYGPLGQYGGGFYNNAVARVYGVGETTSAEYDLSNTYVVTLDHGIHSSGDKAPDGAPSAFGDPYDPAAWVHHAHVGIVKKGELTFQAQLHWLKNFSLDDRGLLKPNAPPTSGSYASFNPDPRPETPTGLGPGANVGLDESVRRDDGNYEAIGASFTLKGNGYRAGVGGVRGVARNAYALHGMTVSFMGDGKAFSNDWLGPRSFNLAQNNWQGSMWSVATEGEVSWGNLWRAPQPFWGEGFNVTTGAGFQYGRVVSEDPVRAGWGMYRFGLDVLVSMLPWLAVETRADRVEPDTAHGKQAYTALMSQLVFRSYWNSRERVALQYTKWIYGEEFPVAYKSQPTERLDTDVVSFGFGMWW
jgi:hypothetical protein